MAGIAAPLIANLYDCPVLAHQPHGFVRVIEHRRHWLLDEGIFAEPRGIEENWRVCKVGSGDDLGVLVVHGEKIGVT